MKNKIPKYIDTQDIIRICLKELIEYRSKYKQIDYIINDGFYIAINIIENGVMNAYEKE